MDSSVHRGLRLVITSSVSSDKAGDLGIYPENDRTKKINFFQKCSLDVSINFNFDPRFTLRQPVAKFGNLY